MMHQDCNRRAVQQHQQWHQHQQQQQEQEHQPQQHRISKLRKMEFDSSPFQEQQRSESPRCLIDENSKRTRRQCIRAVSFSDKSSVVVLPSRTSTDATRCWYSRSELAEFKSTMKLSALSLRETRTAKLMKHMAFLAATTSSNTTSQHQQQNDDCSTTNSLFDMNSQGKAAIRGMEHLLSPTVCKLLVQRRRLVVHRVLEEQGRMNDDPMMYSNYIERATRIARTSMKNSKFSKEWTSKVTSLQQAL